MAPSLPSNRGGGQRCGRTTPCAHHSAAGFGGAFGSLGCVPNGPPTIRWRFCDGEPGSPQAAASVARRAPRHQHAARRLGAQRDRLGSGAVAARAPSAPLGASFEDNFERPALGADWHVTPGGDWHIDEGRLCVQGRAQPRRRGSTRTLPTNARIEFDAVSDSPDGDIKAEICGDGASAATGASLQRRHQLPHHLRRLEEHLPRARALNEHASDRPEIKHRARLRRRASAPGQRGQVYHFKIERADGKTPQLVGRRHAHVQVRRSAAAHRPRARSLRLQRLGSAGLLRQREGRPLCTS